MSSKILDGANVAACGMLRVITALEFLQHHFAKLGHRNTSCDPHLHQAIEQPTLHCFTRSVRRRAATSKRACVYRFNFTCLICRAKPDILILVLKWTTSAIENSALVNGATSSVLFIHSHLAHQFPTVLLCSRMRQVTGLLEVILKANVIVSGSSVAARSPFGIRGTASRTGRYIPGERR